MFFLLLFFGPFLLLLMFVVGVHILAVLWPVLLIAVVGWVVYKIAK
jgi:hypothetical protein